MTSRMSSAEPEERGDDNADEQNGRHGHGYTFTFTILRMTRPPTHHGAGADINQLAAQGIVKQHLGIAMVGEVDEKEHHDRQQRQDDAGQAALSGINPHFALDAQAFANHVHRALQDVHQVAAGFLLHQHGGNHELQVGRGNAARQLHQGFAMGQAEVLLLIDFAKLGTSPARTLPVLRSRSPRRQSIRRAGRGLIRSTPSGRAAIKAPQPPRT